jgi:hypothetical protein
MDLALPLDAGDWKLAFLPLKKCNSQPLAGNAQGNFIMEN